MSGAQLAAAVRVKVPHLPIIVATGYAEVPDEITQYPRLQKPFTAAELVCVISTALTNPSAEIIDFPVSRP
jgi:FixJ family two-component response regulator